MKSRSQLTAKSVIAVDREGGVAHWLERPTASPVMDAS